MYEIENYHWWFKGLHELVEHYVQELNQNNLNILDAGCGTGAMSEILSKYGTVDGIDFSSDAIEFCKNRGLKNIVLQDINDWRGKDGYYDIIVCLDVLNHQGIKNDTEIVKRFYSSLKEEGILIINLPAFESLRRGHDFVVKTARRYTRKRIEDIMRKGGFSVYKTTYRLPLLFILIKLIKTLQIFMKSSFREKSDTQHLSKIINNLILMIVRIENLMLKSNINMVFGSSVFAVAKRENDQLS